MPAYAPELNPGEGVWQHLKNVETRNLCCNDMPHLSKELNLAVKRLRNKPSLIQSFFGEAGLDI
jgi:putative transposase